MTARQASHSLFGARLLLAATLLGLLAGSCVSSDEPEVDAKCQADSTSIYERRIAPLLSDDRPSSCNQCHLSGVDLSLFARDTPCETMACLKELDLVDLQRPEQSVVLTWIGRAEPEGLITQAVIDEEYAGFLEWIELHASCGDGLCGDVRCGTRADDFCAHEQEPDAGALAAIEDPGGCDDRALEALFQQTVYAWRGRCFPCHHDSQPFAAPDAPRYFVTGGNCDSASLATMRNIIASGYADPDDPEQSLLLLKPLAKSAGGVEHGGHDKMANTNDLAYRAFLQWLERYAACF